MDEGSSIYQNYVPQELVTKEKFTFKDLITLVKCKSVEASSQIVQFQIQVENNTINLAQMDMKSHKLSFNYPFDNMFNQIDRADLLLYAYENKLFKVRSNRHSKISKVKKESGSEAQKQGCEFEQYCADKLNESNEFRNNLVLKMLKDLGLNPAKTQVAFIHQGNEYVPNLNGAKVLPKADILVQIQDLAKQKTYHQGISVKKTNLATQVHICSVDGLKQILKMKYQIVMPKIVERALKKFAGVDGFTPQELLTPLEIKKLEQGDRNRYLIHELSRKEQSELKLWFKTHLKEIITLILSEGSITNPQYHAQYMLINQTSYTQASDWNPLVVDIASEISQVQEVSFSESGGTIKLGSKITLQMKGSGSGNQRSALQFKKSL